MQSAIERLRTNHLADLQQCDDVDNTVVERKLYTKINSSEMLALPRSPSMQPVDFIGQVPTRRAQLSRIGTQFCLQTGLLITVYVLMRTGSSKGWRD